MLTNDRFANERQMMKGKKTNWELARKGRWLRITNKKLTRTDLFTYDNRKLTYNIVSGEWRK